MVELRKRPARAPPAETRPAKKKAAAKPTPAPKKAAKAKAAAPAAAAALGEASEPKEEEDKAPAKVEKPDAEPSKPDVEPSKQGPPAVGDTIDLEGFGGELETQDGKKVTLKKLVDESKAGVVLFTYPKANTPGCTVQACAFRDGSEYLHSKGLVIYGLSGDSPKSNTTFKTKQNLQYDLLCNSAYTLIGAIGMQQGTAHKTKRGVFAVDKSGKVLLSFAGGPKPTVDAVKKLVDEMDKV
ncbi:thioredoxin-like protein [Microthyrium microscopicum]|uniref:thioredoxin-dependent peroxiredoxin n=1 Tax=Microthyrium microscopicum TaxID=703497 RepID=A0A6A6U0S1_9PEZI|nr:thioredoxin-like protein [Microthyrium microscopicum]